VRPELLHSFEPVDVRRPLRAASGLPQFVSESLDFGAPEGRDAMLASRRLRMPIRVAIVIEGLPGMFVSRQMLLLAMLFGDTMGMGGAVL
jgi:hypothetical protein